MDKKKRLILDYVQMGFVCACWLVPCAIYDKWYWFWLGFAIGCVVAIAELILYKVKGFTYTRKFREEKSTKIKNIIALIMTLGWFIFVWHLLGRYK